MSYYIVVRYVVQQCDRLKATALYDIVQYCTNYIEKKVHQFRTFTNSSETEEQ